MALTAQGAKTSGRDEPASQVVNMASPVQFAGVQAGYTMTATG